MKKQLLVLLVLFSCNKIFSQDLVPAFGNIISTTISSANSFHISFQVQNIGGANAPQSYAGIRISLFNNGTNLTSLGFTSVEPLTAGQTSAVIDYLLPLPYNITTGTYYVYIETDPFAMIAETNETNNFGLLASSIAVTQDASTTSQNIPYPVLFVHGWLGDNTSWLDFGDNILNAQYGWTNGGVLDFCLNYDNDTSTSNLVNDFHDYVATAYLKPADYYFINFDIAPNGDWFDFAGENNNAWGESNQSAARKQGYAVGVAVNYILNITGRDKVILVGHSMGGLASREYLQRWTQGDGLTHIAKLFTCGSPHQGSNSTAFGLSNLGSYSHRSPDEKSEAVRDLRRSYSYSGYDGAYLFGGCLETNSYIQNNSFYYYHNVDVNCNGILGESVLGLDYSTNVPDINYSCVIGTGDYCLTGTSATGDGVVEDWSANLYNAFLGGVSPNYIDTLYVPPLQYYGCGLPNPDFLHSHINKAEYGINDVKGLDEPDFYDATGYGHAYGIEFNKLYYGVIADKSIGAYYGTANDYDDYKFIQTTTSNIQVNVYNIDVSNMTVRIYSSSNLTIPIYTTSSNGKGNVSFTVNSVPAGTYYFEIVGNPSANLSWYRSYGFKLTNSITTDVPKEETVYLDANLFPNPSSDFINVQIISNNITPLTIEMVNILGETVYNETIQATTFTKIDLSNITNGVYFVRIIQGDKQFAKKIIVNK